MPSTVVLGTQYGDEGKGKTVDFLAKDADFIVRYSGGNNAGHTLVIGGEQTILHFLPSGVFHEKTCVMGNGMVLDLEKLKEEIDEVESKGVKLRDRLVISENAHLILPGNVEASQTQATSSTGRGITPAYTSKAHKSGLRVRDIINIEKGIPELDLGFRDNLTKYKDYLLKHLDIRNNIGNVSKILNEALDQGKNIIFEGAQATGLDIDFGQYPYITSSNPTAGGACTGTGVPPTRIDKVIGVAKAYTTRVDLKKEGPLTTQLDDELGDKIREAGKEYGATTGYPRRCGWFDAVLVKHSVRINGISELTLTKLDVLDDLPEVKICTHYELDGEQIEDFPSDGITQRRCKPVYISLPGWKGSISNCKTFEELPENCKNYVRKIEELLGVKVTIIGVGPDREQTIFRNN